MRFSPNLLAGLTASALLLCAAAEAPAPANPDAPTYDADGLLIPVWSRYSCGPLIELQQSTEAFLTLDATGMLRQQRNRGRQEQLIAFALVRAFEMIMCNELSYCPAQGRFTKENQLR